MGWERWIDNVVASVEKNGFALGCVSLQCRIFMREARGRVGVRAKLGEGGSFATGSFSDGAEGDAFSVAFVPF